MRSTGFFDSNNTLIHEGDVVQIGYERYRVIYMEPEDKFYLFNLDECLPLDSNVHCLSLSWFGVHVVFSLC